MPLWPFCPTPVVTESLSWLSDVLDPYATQQVAALRVAPRQGFRFDHVFKFRQYERAMLLMELAAAGEWDVPVWPERQRFDAAIAATVIVVDTASCDYREGGTAVLWQSDEACEAIEIDTVAPGALTLATPTSRAYSGALVMPGRVARCLGGLQASRTVQPYHAASTEWMVYEGIDLSGASEPLYPTYRDHPVVTDAPCIGGGTIEMGVMRDQEIVDSETGLPYFDTVSARVTRPLGMGWMVSTLPGLWALRRFLHDLRGRQKGFWLPTWSRGLQLAAPVAPADTTLTVLAVGFNVAAETGDVMIKTHAGQQTFLRYTAATASGGHEILTLSGAAGVSIAPAEVHTFCRLHFCRQAADLVEIRHEHTGTGPTHVRQVSTVLIRALEVPLAGAPVPTPTPEPTPEPTPAPTPGPTPEPTPGERSLLYEGDFEEHGAYPAGVIQSHTTLANGGFIKAMKDTGYVDGNDKFENGGAGGYGVGIDSDLRLVASEVVGAETVTPRNGSYFIRAATHYTSPSFKDYNILNNGTVGDFGGSLDKPRNAFSLANDVYVLGWDKEFWWGFSVYTPANYDHDNPAHANGSAVQFAVIGAHEGSSGHVPLELEIRAVTSHVASKYTAVVTHNPINLRDDEPGAVKDLVDLGSIADDVGHWTDWIVRARLNPFTATTNPYIDLGLSGAVDASFPGNKGILQVWKSTGPSRAMALTALNIVNAPVGLVPKAGTPAGVDVDVRQYKYGWKKIPTDAVSPVWLGFDEIRFGETLAHGTGYPDVHPDQESMP